MPVIFRSGSFRFFFFANEGRELLRLVEANRERIEKAWSDFFR